MENESKKIIDLKNISSKLLTERFVFMRYFGQGHEIKINIDNRKFTNSDIKYLKNNFENEYKKLYGRVLPNAEIEAMTWIVSISINQKSEKKIADINNHLLKSSKDKMRILSIENSKYIDIAHYERKDLKPGNLIKGGCVISEEQTTTIVSKKFQTKVLSNGYLEITEIRGAK